MRNGQGYIFLVEQSLRKVWKNSTKIKNFGIINLTTRESWDEPMKKMYYGMGQKW
jgi:hypothetical protein